MGESAQMSSALKTTLRRICCENGWSYGVFWRFDHRNSMLLTLEDAYFEEQMGTMLGNMLLQVHMLGEGIIGQSAFTGKHQWMFSDAGSGEWDSSDSFGNRDLFQGDYEIHRQFSSGIKTIAVISVEPLGVVLFGSTHKILESVQFLDQAKRLLREMDNVEALHPLEYLPASFNNETSDFGGLFASLISFGNSYNGNLGSSNGNISNAVGMQTFGVGAEVLLSNETPCIGNRSSEGSILTLHEAQLPSSVVNIMGDSPFTSLHGTGGLVDEGCSGKSMHNQHPVKLISTSEGMPDGSMTDPSKCYMVDNLSELFAPSSENNMNEMAMTMALNSHPSQSTHASVLSSGLVGSDCFIDIPITRQEKPGNFHDAGNDFLDSLGMDFGYTLGEDCWEDIVGPVVSSGQSTISVGISECISGLGAGPINGPRKGLFSELGLEELLNGIGNSSSVSKSSSVDQFSSTERRRMESSSVDSNQVQLSSVSMQPAYSLNKISSTAEPKKLEEPTKGTRKRARPGESTRPRPKDRQMIQDHLTELRKIIPNGHKPSIDVLLDRTIKYMLFLQSVTKYADKLKQADEPKMIDKENGVVLKDSSREGGVTWAYEVGDQTLVCPIVVEDLSPPGQMLIEMLCEDHGFFLEIADILRGFGLNILKGVMELRENKIWARFIVEADKHVTRMDIFWSLIQLLQQTATSGIDSTNPHGNVVDHSIHVLKNNQQPPVSFPISLAETLQ